MLNSVLVVMSFYTLGLLVLSIITAQLNFMQIMSLVFSTLAFITFGYFIYSLLHVIYAYAVR